MTTLCLDFDGYIPPQFFVRLAFCARLWRWGVEDVRIDRTAHGYHALVRVRRRLSPAVMVAAQAILGSDVKREAFNLMRVQGLAKQSAFWRARWNVLYAAHYRGVTVKNLSIDALV